MELACLIISIVALIAVIVLIVIVLTRKQNTVEMPQLDLKEIGALSKQIELLSKETKSSIELAVSREMTKLAQGSSDASEKNNEKLERFQNNITESLAKRFDSLNRQIDEKLAEINKKVDEKLTEGFKGTSETMSQVRERLQAIDVAQKNIEKLSTDVISLKNVLEGNQSRGQYGEYQLSMVLHNVFGDTTGCYAEQYTLKKAKDGDDVRADAVVFMPEPNKMICIDSKFPFQDYARMFETDNDSEKEELLKYFSAAVKKHITVIKDKYIVENKTAPEAIIFIPNDGVFAFIHHNCQDIVEYAREKKVIMTSPSTLPAILVTINMVRLEVERAKNAKIISEQIAKLGKQFTLFEKEWDTFSKQLETATRSREKLDSRVSRITSKFESISGSSVSEDESDVGQIESSED